MIVVMAARTFKSFLELKIPKQFGYFCLFGIDYFALFRLGNIGVLTPMGFSFSLSDFMKVMFIQFNF